VSFAPIGANQLCRQLGTAYTSDNSRPIRLKVVETLRGSVQFVWGLSLPTNLIRRIVEFRIAENIGEGSK
jgi:hypothetical protein